MSINDKSYILSIMKDPIFIVGLPRSGSTLWHNIFAKNPAICRMGEMHFLTPVRKDFRYFLKKHVGDLTKDDNVRKMVEMIFSTKRRKGLADGFWTFDLKESEDHVLKDKIIKKIIDSDRSLESIFKTIIEEFVLYKNKSRCCIKFPVYVNYVPKLIEWYPECKIVHITRDPRAIAISRKNDPGGTRKKTEKYPYLSYFIKNIMILFVVFQYRWTSKLHSKYYKYSNYKLFKYEDLLVDPKKTIEKLCEHTAIEFNKEMLNPDKAQASSITDKKQKGFDKKAAFRWSNHISVFENRIVSLLTRASMKRFDYNPDKYIDEL